jgi:hypothetical protein
MRPKKPIILAKFPSCGPKTNLGWPPLVYSIEKFVVNQNRLNPVFNNLGFGNQWATSGHSIFYIFSPQFLSKNGQKLNIFDKIFKCVPQSELVKKLATSCKLDAPALTEDVI